MLNGFFTNYGSAIFVGILLCVTLSHVISSSRKSRKEKPDPEPVFASIHGMYVCYQCDTIFNTPQCPKCNEDAVIPLVHLTGSVIEDERVTAILDKLQQHNSWKIPAFQEGQAVTLLHAPSSKPESSNGGASEAPVKLSAIRAERVQESS